MNHNAAPLAQPLLSLEGVSFRYPGSPTKTLPALEGVSLDIHPGDRVGVVGPNGGGKTTLVKLILGLFRPTSGLVTLCGRSARWSRHLPEVGYIGNPSRNDGESGLPLDLSVGTLLDSHQALFSRSGFDYPHASVLAARLDLDKPEWRRKCVHELSDGWRQRVLAYLALAKQPKLLIADEATAGLDPPHRKALLDTIGHALGTTDMAVMWVTHDHNELLALRLRKVIRVERGHSEQVRLTGWHCEFTVDLGQSQRLHLTVDALFELFSELALDPKTQNVQLNMVRHRAEQEEVGP
jgi:ABC-type multidrug transport system ATPase subunit